MGLVFDIFPLATLVSAATALVVALAGRRFWPGAARERMTLPAALATGYVAGYAALPVNLAAWKQQLGAFAATDLGAVQIWNLIAPQQESQWLPYLAVVAAALSAVPDPTWRVMRPGVLALVSSVILAAWLLTPAWPVFGAHRPLSIGVALSYFLLIGFPLELLPPRYHGRILVGLLAIAAGLAAIAIGIQVSIRLAQLAAIAAGAISGCWIAQILDPKSVEGARGRLVPLFAVLVAGAAFVAAVEPDPACVTLFAPPVTPLLGWLGTIGRRRAPAR